MLSKKTVVTIHKHANQSNIEKSVYSQNTDNKHATKGSVEVNKLVFCAPNTLVAQLCSLSSFWGCKE